MCSNFHDSETFFLQSQLCKSVLKKLHSVFNAQTGRDKQSKRQILLYEVVNNVVVNYLNRRNTMLIGE